MNSEHVDRFITLFVIGLGLLITGGANLFLSQIHRGWKGLCSLIGCGTVLLLINEITPANLESSALYLGLIVAGSWLVGSKRFDQLTRIIVDLIQRTSIRWSLVCGFGISTLILSMVQFKHEDERAMDFDMHQLGLMSPPDFVRSSDMVAKTDQGNTVALMKAAVLRDEATLKKTEHDALRCSVFPGARIVRQPADDCSNCHGWVYTGGKFWVPGDAVKTILKDNGYTKHQEPKPGDLVIYHDHDFGSILHSAVVRYVSGGMPVLVEGKWAWMGVYLHPVDQSIYGTHFTYFRSPRTGHLLQEFQQFAAAR